ncbi:alpha-agarase precursor [bacterium BMS3Abin03]|nr:alpha-agarase precursor [bacterium BMS3Abin03]
MRAIVLSILVGGTICLSSSFAQVAGDNGLNILSGRWVISAENGITHTKSDFKNALSDYYARFMSEYFFPTQSIGIFGLRAFSGIGRLSGSGGVSNYPKDEFRTSIVLAGAGIDYVLTVSDKLFPFIYAGASYLYFDPSDIDGNKLPNNASGKYSLQEVSYQGELGIRFMLNKNFSLNINASLNYVYSDELDDIIAGRDNDIFFTMMGGFSYYFDAIFDSDKDGVEDQDDACPDTPVGVRVNEFGCPIDTDRDGVPDYLDKCPQTRSNIIVGKDGCPLDSDSDGVPDYLDQCFNTPLGVPVNKRGCPFDSDGDGVPDYMDKCPKTPSGTEVNKFGCPTESQGKELSKIPKIVLSGEVNFAPGKSEFHPDANAVLKIAAVLKDNPDTQWKIEGHTDNIGSYEFNKKLSLERARSVANYLIDNGIEASRLQVVGLGPDFPIGDNSTASGRALNRRVTIEMVDSIAKEDQYVPPVKKARYNSSIERNVGDMIFTDGNLYCFQLSAWRTHKKAQKEADKLKARGENAFIIKVSDIPGLKGTWYRVRIGYFNSLSETKKHKRELNK